MMARRLSNDGAPTILRRRLSSGSYARDTYNAPGFAQAYGDYVKVAPWRIYGERHTQKSILGNLRGKRVLDLACGDGINARWLNSLGAREVVGVDISSEMVKLAEASTSVELPISYVCADAVDIGSTSLVGEAFDVVLANYLLNYAESEAALVRYLSAIRRVLRPSGGFLLAANDWCEPAAEGGAMPPTGRIDQAKHGFVKTMRPEDVGVNGAPILIEMIAPTPPHDEWPTAPNAAEPGTKLIEFLNFYHDRATHDRAFAAAGFAAPIERHYLSIDPEGLAKCPDGWWDFYLQPHGGTLINYVARV